MRAAKFHGEGRVEIVNAPEPQPKPDEVVDGGRALVLGAGPIGLGAIIVLARMGFGPSLTVPPSRQCWACVPSPVSYTHLTLPTICSV